MNTFSPTQRHGASAVLFVGLLFSLLAVGACSSASDATAPEDTPPDVATADSIERCASDDACGTPTHPAADASTEAQDAAVLVACEPGAVACAVAEPFGEQPQRCTDRGEWENVGKACGTDEYCVRGTCAASEAETPPVVVPGVDDVGEVAEGAGRVQPARLP